jgi:hypothetical protein
MLTFHDWLIAGGNRLGLLDRILDLLPTLPVRPVTVNDVWEELAGLAGRQARSMAVPSGGGGDA